MSYFLDFKERISKIHKGQVCSVNVNGIKVEDKTGEIDMFRRQLGGVNRIHGSPIPVIAAVNGFRCLEFSLSEYPSCCGKSLLHGIMTNYLIYSHEDEFLGQLNDDQKKDINKEIYILAVKMSAYKGYSSMDFILSLKDNYHFVQAMKELKIEPVFSFQNFRMKRDNPCYNYSIAIPECKERFEKVDDVFLRENVGI